MISHASRAANYFGTSAAAVVSADRRRLRSRLSLHLFGGVTLILVVSRGGAQAASGALHN